MLKSDPKHQEITEIFLAKGQMQPSEVHKEMAKAGKDLSLITIKRALSRMVNEGILMVSGSGRSTSYEISLRGRIFSKINAEQYVAIEPDKRYGLSGYNFDLFKSFPPDIFTSEELKRLETFTTEYREKVTDLPDTIQKKELERLVIELSWKSSKIEGNTYTLLDTEKLILENKEAIGHSKNEAKMILNHKDAFGHIYRHKEQFETLTRKNLEDLHSIMIKDLDVSTGFRAKPVGITGSIYRPLDNVYQITEAVENLSTTISKNNTPYAKALLALLGINYIQPFEDGNKRTSRLMANALLLSHSMTPLSYRSIDEEEYRAALLAFYELNSIMPMKKIFIGQYEFAAANYLVK